MRQENEPSLPNADIPCDQRDGVVPAKHGHGEIEGSDDSHQA